MSDKCVFTVNDSNEGLKIIDKLNDTYSSEEYIDGYENFLDNEALEGDESNQESNNSCNEQDDSDITEWRSVDAEESNADEKASDDFVDECGSRIEYSSEVFSRETENSSESDIVRTANKKRRLPIKYSDEDGSDIDFKHNSKRQNRISSFEN